MFDGRYLETHSNCPRGSDLRGHSKQTKGMSMVLKNKVKTHKTKMSPQYKSLFWFGLLSDSGGVDQHDEGKLSSNSL